jgi:hypothetical protein
VRASFSAKAKKRTCPLTTSSATSFQHL